VCVKVEVLYNEGLIKVEMSKWVLTYELTRLITDLSQIGLKKIQFFQKWVEFNSIHLTYGFELG